MTAITAAIFAVDASAVVPTIPNSSPLKVDFSTTTGIQNVTNVPLANILYVTGSSAASKFLPNTITTLAMPGTVVYKYQNAPANDIFTYVFTAGEEGVKAGLTLNNTYVIHQRTRDGSMTAALIASVATPDKALGVTFNSLADFATNAATFTCTSAAASTATNVITVTCSGTTPEKLVVAPATAKGVTGTSSVLGLADVDAAQFASELNGANKANGLLNTGTAAAPKGAAAMGSSPVAAQVFGIATNLKLYKAMQTAQLASGSLPSTCTVGDDTEACMPGFTSEQITSIFAKGRFNDWSKLSFGAGNDLVSANATNKPANTAVHLCSRASGSGTLASLQSVFENAPCSVNEAIQAATTTTIYPAATNVAGTELANASEKVYHSTVGSGDLENCLATFDGYDTATKTAATSGINGNGNFGAGTGNKISLSPPTTKDDFRWAVGILNADRNGNKALPYRFVKIDGYAPSLVNTANGKYRFWSELSYITSKPGTALTGTAAAIVKAMSVPAIIAKGNPTTATWSTTAANASGYMATAGQAISGVTAFDPKLPVMPFTHADGANKAGSVNHCRAPAILNGKVTLPGLN